ncbi:MAG: hypothetical protein SGI92_18765 [Bryobacteraceae bacterium]|nr:hypothetical protein [Bryobacteraceae bacterium]
MTLAHAGVVYTNGLPDGAGGVEMTRYMQAEDINPLSDVTFNVLRFWTREPTGGGAYNGFIDWVINLNSVSNFPLPDRVTATNGGAIRTFSQVLTGSYDEYQIDLSLVTPITLTAGTTYWFSLHNGGHTTETADEDFMWGTTATPVGFSSYHFDMQATPAPGPWVTNGGTELAYQLLLDESLLTPEPGTWTMMAGAVAGLAALRQRRQVAK